MTINSNRLRILVAEDENLLAMILEDELLTAGHTILGPFAEIETLQIAVESEQFDIALLDINLRGKSTLNIAAELQSQNRPFILLSGYGRSNLPDALRDAPCLQKPYEAADLHAEIIRATERNASPGLQEENS